MTSYEGLFLETNRWDEGRMLLERAAGTLSQGMLANTADAGGTVYNTADGTLWFLHAVGRHVEVTGDLDLAGVLLPALEEIVEHHVAGTRVEINALWINGLATVADLQARLGRDASRSGFLEARARAVFRDRFVRGGALLDVIDGPDATRPRYGRTSSSRSHCHRVHSARGTVVRECTPLVTSLGLRSLAPWDCSYRGRHRGGVAQRDEA